MSTYDFFASEVRDPELKAHVEFLRINGIRLHQVCVEIDMLAEYMRSHGHTENDVFVELGSDFMGSTLLFSTFVRPGGHIVSVDVANPRPYKHKQMVLHELCKMYSVTVISKKTDQAVEDVRRATGGKIDYLHIDACHSYEAAKRDFENYVPMVRPGGVVQIHDICLELGRPDLPTEVPRLWKELKEQYTTHEFIDYEYDDPITPGCIVGIGVVEV